MGSYAQFVAHENSVYGVGDWTLDDILGSWGVDLSAAGDVNGVYMQGDAWAVLDHNSDFAVFVPEPTSLAFLGLGAVGLLARRRRR